jgi:hypothetical protein
MSKLIKNKDTNLSNQKEISILQSKNLLIHAVDQEDASMALQLATELELEFKATSSSEKMLVHMAVQSFVRMNKCSRLMTVNTPSPHIWHECAHHMSVYSKEIDKAFRQNIAALQTLKAMKQPAIKVNIKTNNAFVAENMQNNSTLSPKDQNNDPQ